MLKKIEVKEQVKAEKLHALELSLTIGCKVDCIYCPQKLLLNRYYSERKDRKNKLSFEDFKIALDKVQAGATISFCGMSEPFLNERCADMICYAYEKGYKISLLTTLVGMTMEDFNKIKTIKFDSFVLHIPDEEGHSKFEITGEYRKLLESVNKTIDIDYYSCHGNVNSLIQDIIDKEKYAGIALGNRAGNLEGFEKMSTYKNGRIACYHGSEAQVGGWAPVMFPDGSLVLCCQDYGMKHVLGNLITQSWLEICEGEEYKKFKNGLTDDTIDILCRTCGDAVKVEDLPAMQLKKIISDIRLGKKEQNFSDDMNDLLQRFVAAENVCVFGIGKLWRDHFYQEYWHEGLEVTVFSDNNPELYGTHFNGIECVKPSELGKYQNLLVVLFVKNGDSIISQLNNMGINNCILIGEIDKKCRVLQKVKKKSMTK